MTHSKLLSGRSGRQCPSHLPNKQNHPLEIAASVVSMMELCFVCLTVTHTVPIVLTTLLHARLQAKGGSSLLPTGARHAARPVRWSNPARLHL